MRGWGAWHPQYGLMLNTFHHSKRAAYNLWRSKMFSCTKSIATKVKFVEVEIRQIDSKKEKNERRKKTEEAKQVTVPEVGVSKEPS